MTNPYAVPLDALAPPAGVQAVVVAPEPRWGADPGLARADGAAPDADCGADTD